MRRTARAFAAASIVLFGAAAVQAAKLDRPPFQAPAGPIEPGVLDPTDQCLLHPQLCDPTEPPPNPCIENPELCVPQDPCEQNPELCDPVDPCELDPTLCEEEPPVAEEPPQAPGIPFSGASVTRVDGVKLFETFPATLSFSTAAGTFLMMDSNGAVYTGNLAPKGKSGRKFTMFLDGPSSDAFTAFVADHGAAVAGSPAGTVLGDTSKLVLKLEDEGAVSVKIRSEVLTSSLGAIVFKARLEGFVH
jgi:hypothetical protein